MPVERQHPPKNATTEHRKLRILPRDSFTPRYLSLLSAEKRMFPAYFVPGSDTYRIKTDEGSVIAPTTLRDLYFQDPDRDKEVLQTLLTSPWLIAFLPSKIRRRIVEEKIKGAELNGHLKLKFHFDKEKHRLTWKDYSQDCQTIHEAFALIIQSDKELAAADFTETKNTYPEKQIEDIFSRVSIYQVLESTAIPRNPAHLRVSPGEHTREVQRGAILKGLSPELTSCARIILKLHDVGKVATALNDNRQHHHIISAEFYEAYCQWARENKDTDQLFVSKEPYATIIKTVIRCHDVGGLMGKGVFNDEDVMTLISRETKDLSNNDIKPFRSREEFLAAIFVLLGVLSSADALSVKDYEHFAVYNTWTFIRMFEENFDISAKQKYSTIIQEHAKMVQDNISLLAKARDKMLKDIEKIDRNSQEFRYLSQFLARSDNRYVMYVLGNIANYYNNHIATRPIDLRNAFEGSV